MLLAGGDHRACGVLLASLLPDRLDFLVAFGEFEVGNEIGGSAERQRRKLEDVQPSYDHR